MKSSAYRLAIAEISLDRSPRRSRPARSRVAPGAAGPGDAREPQPPERRERRLEFRECAEAPSRESERPDAQARRVARSDLRRAVRGIIDSGGVVGQTGPLIADAAGNPIWFQPVSNDNTPQVLGFQAQTLFGQPVLTWWQGTVVGAASTKLPAGTAQPGEFVIANQHYQIIKTIRAPAGVGIGLARAPDHAPKRRLFHHGQDRQGEPDRLRRPGEGGVHRPAGPRGGPADREDDLHLGHGRARPLKRFGGPGPHDLGPGLGPLPPQFDRREPRRLASPGLRANTWGIYDVSHSTGQLLWQLGGKQNQFALPTGLVTGPFNSAFQYQHDARFVPGGISLFDDAGAGAPPYGGPYGEARGLILNLDLQDDAASLASPADVHDPAIYREQPGEPAGPRERRCAGRLGPGCPVGRGDRLVSHGVFRRRIGPRRLRAGRPGDFLPRVQPPLGGPSAHEAVRRGLLLGRTNDRVRVVERLDGDAGLGAARGAEPRVALGSVDHAPLGVRDGDFHRGRRTLLRGQGARRGRQHLEHLRRHPRAYLMEYSPRGPLSPRSNSRPVGRVCP